jgi:transposase
MKKQRKHYTPEERVAILRRHLVEGVPTSDLCDERGLQPTVYYRWQKEFFENGAAAFQQRGRTDHQAEQERIAYLEKKIQTKDVVLVELMAEHVALKKRVGERTRVLIPAPGSSSGRQQSQTERSRQFGQLRGIGGRRTFRHGQEILL